jgi:tetratricopeptide (TPR) repeat protein
MTTPTPRISRQSKLVLVIAAAAGLIVALWLTFGPQQRIVGPPGPPSPPAGDDDPREAVRAEIPEALALRPDSVAPGTRALAATLPVPAPEAAAAIAKARHDGLLPARPLSAPAHGAPRMAGELADAMTKKTPLPASSFELATMLGGVLKTRGARVAYAAIPNARWSATELLARRFAVRVDGGPWVAPDGGPTDGASLLSELDFLGYQLAFRARGAIARGDADTASRAAGLARRLLPDDPAIAFVVAETQALNGLPDEARRTFDRAAQLAADALTWYRLGRFAREEERPFKADEYFNKAAQLDPTFAAPHVGLAELALERLDVTPKDEHPGLIERANEAIAAAERADPDAAGLRIVKAHLASLAGKEDESRALLEEEVRLHPEDPLSFVMLANVYAALERDDDALKTLEDARAAGHASADVLDGLGALYALKGRFADAAAAYDQLLALTPDNPLVRLQLAQLEREQGRLQRARQLLDQQIARFPNDATGALLLAQLELADDKPDKAKLLVARVLSRDPHNKEAILLDYFIAAVGDTVSAEARARAIAAVGARRKLAELLLQNGLVAEAEVVLADAVNAEPDDIVAPVLLVAIYHVTQREAQAKALRESTLAKIDPSQRAEIQALFEDALAQALRAREPQPLSP